MRTPAGRRRFLGPEALRRPIEGPRPAAGQVGWRLGWEGGRVVWALFVEGRTHTVKIDPAKAREIGIQWCEAADRAEPAEVQGGNEDLLAEAAENVECVRPES